MKVVERGGKVVKPDLSTTTPLFIGGGVVEVAAMD
jgi:hypothetical protein